MGFFVRFSLEVKAKSNNYCKSLSLLTSLIKNLTFHFLQATLKDMENVFKNLFLSLFVYYLVRNNSCNNGSYVDKVLLGAL